MINKKNIIYNNFKILSYFIIRYWKDYSILKLISKLYIINLSWWYWIFDMWIKFDKEKKLKKLEIYTSVDFLNNIVKYNKDFRVTIDKKLLDKLNKKYIGYSNKDFYISIDLNQALFNNNTLFINELDYYLVTHNEINRTELVYTLNWNKSLIKNHYHVYYRENSEISFCNKDFINKEYFINIDYYELIYCYKNSWKFLVYWWLYTKDFLKLLKEKLWISLKLKEELDTRMYSYWFSYANDLFSNHSLYITFR